MTQAISRRTLLTESAAFGLCGAFNSETNADEVSVATSEEAMQRLVAGDARFVAGKTRHAHEGADWRKHLVGSQQPFATILGCSDSRAPVELVFDQGFGDLFVVRVAGNVISPDVIGSLAYAVAHLDTKLVVVKGHEGCDAVTAALAEQEKPGDEPEGIKSLLKLIEPGLPKSPTEATSAERLHAVVEANVRWSLKQLMQIPAAQTAVAEKRLALKGGLRPHDRSSSLSGIVSIPTAGQSRRACVFLSVRFQPYTSDGAEELQLLALLSHPFLLVESVLWAGKQVSR